MVVSLLVAAAGIAADPPTSTVELRATREISGLTLSPVEMFAIAEVAERNDNVRTASAVYRALSSNPTLQVRNEARFRFAMLLVRKQRLIESAVLLRNILDEQPDANRVRIELAALLASMGDEASARRELRAARAGALPAEVAQQIDRFSAALRARKPIGASLQIGLASDSNINRATRSDTLGTIVGDFILDDDAKARSGTGLAIHGQTYGRLLLTKRHRLLATLSGSGQLYREKRFRDVSLGGRAGPELQLGSNRLNVSAGVGRRWFGGDRLSTWTGGQATLTRSVTATAHVRASASADRVNNHRNALESGWTFTGSTVLETAVSQRSGVGVALTGVRQSSQDPGYSTKNGHATLFGYHELGRMTLSGAASVGRLSADKRLSLYPEKRQESLVRATFGATLRQLTVGGFAPTAQFTIERNRSTIGLYDYRRNAIELGVARAF